MQQAKFAKDLKANAEKRKTKPPTDEEIAKRFKREPRLAAGDPGPHRGEARRYGEGQKLLEEAWAANPNLVVVGATLGELAYKAGDHTKGHGTAGAGAAQRPGSGERQCGTGGAL